MLFWNLKQRTSIITLSCITDIFRITREYKIHTKKYILSYFVFTKPYKVIFSKISINKTNRVIHCLRLLFAQTEFLLIAVYHFLRPSICPFHNVSPFSNHFSFDRDFLVQFTSTLFTFITNVLSTRTNRPPKLLSFAVRHRFHSTQCRKPNVKKKAINK